MNQDNPLVKIAVVSLIGLIIVALIAVYSNESRKTVNEYASYAVQQNAIKVSNEIEIYIQSALSSIQLTSHLVSKTMDNATLENSSEILKTFVGKTPFNFIEYIPASGTNEIDGDSSFDSSDRVYYREGMKGNTGIWVNLHPLLAPEYLLNCYTPLYYENKIVGVLIGAISSKSAMQPLLKSKFFEENMIGILCDSSGNIISATFDFNGDMNLQTAMVMRGISLEGKDVFVNHIESMDNHVFNFYEDGGIGIACVKTVKNMGWTVIQIVPASSFKWVLYKSMYGQIFVIGIIIIIFASYIIYLSLSTRKSKKKILAENKKLSKEKAEDKERYYHIVQEALIKAEKYKSAVLADAIIVFEANLTQNIMDYGKMKLPDGKTKSLDEVIETRFPCTYDYYVEKWSEKIIKPIARESFKRNADRRYLLDCAAVGKSEVVTEYPIKGYFDGEDLYMRRTILLTKDEESGDIIAYCNIKDITAQKEKELMLLNYEKILITTATDMVKGVRQVDLKNFTAVYHYFKDDRIISTDMGDWMSWVDQMKANIYPDDYPKVREFLHKDMLLNMSYGITYKIDYRAMSVNENQTRRVYTTTVSKTFIDEKPYALFVTIDSTSTVENEAAQRKLVEDALMRAQAANEAKSTFLSNMSHDIRTPMNAIVGFTTLALNHIESRNITEDYLNKILSSSKYLLSLINDVLDMSRIESGKIKLEVEEHNLFDIAEELKNIIVSDIKTKNLTLTVDTKNIKNANVICDKLRLNQIMLNLLGNSVKFTKSGGSIEFTIREITRDEKTLYQFIVKDNGIGISEKFISHIFEPFERERTSTVSGIQGTGLGMSITKNLVDMMNGNIDISSTKDVGTEIVVTLPLTIANANTSDISTDDEESNSAYAKETSHIDVTGKHLMLVEDNPLNREIANAILTEAGFEVDEVEDGAYVVEKLLEKGAGYYSLILMDIQMPIMDGYATAKKIREMENADIANIPIIAMTANAFEEDKKKALQSGMDAHIAKPIDISNLFETIEKYLF